MKSGIKKEPEHHEAEAEIAGVDEWKPSFGITIVWTILTLIMTVIGFFVFAYLYHLIGGGELTSEGMIDTGSDGGETYLSVQLDSTLWLVVVAIGVLLLHEAIHGLAFWWFGGRPTFGAAIIQKVLPVLYCSAPGYLFTRGQFAMIILAPLIVISILGTLAMPLVGAGILLVVPLAVNFGGAVGDLWMFGMVLRRAPGTMIEDLKDGLRFHAVQTS